MRIEILSFRGVRFVRFQQCHFLGDNNELILFFQPGKDLHSNEKKSSPVQITVNYFIVMQGHV